MKKTIVWSLAIVFMLLLTGCNAANTNALNPSTIYLCTALVPVIILVAYGYFIRKKNLWFLMMLASEFVANAGYFSISTSQTLDAALLANRIAYFGSIALLLSTLMVILNACKLQPPAWAPPALCAVSFAMFTITASPGYSTLYYKEVTLGTAYGVSVLEKTYGPLHWLYMVFLLAFVAGMLFSIFYAARRKMIAFPVLVTLLFSSVLLNFFVWLIGQVISIEFEFLSISYSFSASLLFMFSLLQQFEQADGIALPTSPTAATAEEFTAVEAPAVSAEEVLSAVEESAEDTPPSPMQDPRLHLLTPTERAVFDLYAEGKRSKEIMEILNIKENTLKYHNKNLYSKLGISSRRQLLELATGTPVASEEEKG